MSEPFDQGAKNSPLPGFGLSLGISLLGLSLFVLLPLGAIFLKAGDITRETLVATFSNRRVIAALTLTVTTSGIAALFNVGAGTVVAWVLARYDFWGKGALEALVDVPFALPTAVAGISLTALYGPNGAFGALLASLGITAAFRPTGIVIALIFVGFPFVVRSVQPVLMRIDRQVEEAAETLGASSFTIFKSITMPAIVPAIISGFGLALARGLGEYGSVVFISGNMPFRTEVVPLLIMTKLEQFDYPGAITLAMMMLTVSALLMICVAWFQHRVARTRGA